MNSCEYKFGLGKVKVYGGPYREKPLDAFGVNMAKELSHLPSDVRVPTKDFDVPNKAELMAGLTKALEAIGRKEAVYVGCMGGVGRTGLFMSVLAKALGEGNPVSFVRSQYNAHAVETEQQKKYVTAFDVEPLKLIALKAKVARAARFWKKEQVI